MTKIETAIARITIIDKANREVAFCRGQIARANNRPRTGVLVPKFQDDAELDSWTAGWDSADSELA